MHTQDVNIMRNDIRKLLTWPGESQMSFGVVDMWHGLDRR